MSSFSGLVAVAVPEGSSFLLYRDVMIESCYCYFVVAATYLKSIYHLVFITEGLIAGYVRTLEAAGSLEPFKK